MDNRKKLFKDVFFYTGSSFLANIFNFITAVVTRKILDPVFIGMFNYIMLFFDYGKNYHLGILNAMDKELAILYGSKDNKKLNRIKDTGFTLCMFGVFSVSMAIFLYSFILMKDDVILKSGVRIVAIMLIFQCFSSLCIVLNRSHDRYPLISKNVLVVAVLDLIIKILFSFWFGIYGLIWASLLTLFLGVLHFYKITKGKFNFLLKISFNEMYKLFKIGFPLFLMGFIFLVIRSIDRIMIMKFLDAEKLGIYSIALIVAGYTLQIPGLVSAVIFPRFYQAFGEKKNIETIKDFFIIPNMIFAYLFPVIIGVLILFLPLLVVYILPKYVSGILAADFLLLGVFFLAFVEMPGYLLTILDKQSHMIIIGLFSIISSIGLILFFVKNMAMGIEGVAIAVSITYFIYATVLLLYAFMQYTKNVFSHLKLLAELYLPFIWMVFVLFILKVFIFKTSGNFFNDCLKVSLKTVLFLLAWTPFLFYINRKTRIANIIRLSWLDFCNKKTQEIT